jgi:phospholipid/cholesterol/gamma-HCH transport system substrate-binding protein
MRKRTSIVIAIAAAVLAALVLLLIVSQSYSRHRLHAKCYFQDAQGLRAGAQVRLAGVVVGSVTGVRVRPDLRDHPAEVEMLISTSYDLKIPEDAVASLETAGVLGEAFVEIDLQQVPGRPLIDGGVLKTRESPRPRDWLACFSNIVEHKPSDLSGTPRDASSRPTPVPGSK